MVSGSFVTLADEESLEVSEELEGLLSESILHLLSELLEVAH